MKNGFLIHPLRLGYANAVFVLMIGKTYIHICIYTRKICNHELYIGTYVLLHEMFKKIIQTTYYIYTTFGLHNILLWKMFHA